MYESELNEEETKEADALCLAMSEAMRDHTLTVCMHSLISLTAGLCIQSAEGNVGRALHLACTCSINVGNSIMEVVSGALAQGVNLAKVYAESVRESHTDETKQ